MTMSESKHAPVVLPQITKTQVMLALELVLTDMSHQEKCQWIADALNKSAAPAPVAQPLTDAQRLKLWHGTSNIVPTCNHYLHYARAVERACAEAWGVKLAEATGQEGGSNG
jgi:hypothetical protein